MDDDIRAVNDALNAAPVPEDNRYMTDADGNIYSTPPTPSNNIDTELREKIKAVGLHWNGKLLEGNNTLGDFFDDGELDVIMSLIAADRDKLIKHLAYEMGENYEAMVKIARTMK